MEATGKMNWTFEWTDILGQLRLDTTKNTGPKDGPLLVVNVARIHNTSHSKLACWFRGVVVEDRETSSARSNIFTM